MFPHLVAGPILKFSFLAHQLEERSLTFEKFARGVALFGLGLGKKVLLANPLDFTIYDLKATSAPEFAIGQSQ